MTVEITHLPGVGDWSYGAVVTLSDRRGQRLIHMGYAKPKTAEVDEKPKARKASKE